MLYDDEARRFNFAGGLLLGLLLGTGVALLTSPSRLFRRPRYLRDSAGRLERSARRGAGRLREEFLRPAMDVFSAVNRSNGATK